MIQVGTATLDLSPLLRQGREFCEVLVELPIMLHDQQQQQAPQMQVWVFQCAFLCVYVYACVELPIMLHDQQQQQVPQMQVRTCMRA